MRMKNPPHPEMSVRYDCLEPLGLSVAEGAKALGVTRQAMHNLVTGKAGISAEMASAWKKRSAAALRHGCGCRPPTTWRRWRNMLERSRSGASKTHFCQPDSDRIKNRAAGCQSENDRA